jgi:hypothetical protein
MRSETNSWGRASDVSQMVEGADRTAVAVRDQGEPGETREQVQVAMKTPRPNDRRIRLQPAVDPVAGVWRDTRPCETHQLLELLFLQKNSDTNALIQKSR